MFSYTGLSEAQVLSIRKKYHVYMLLSGRISISGCEFPVPITRHLPCYVSSNVSAYLIVTMSNVSYVAKAFDDVVRNVA